MGAPRHQTARQLAGQPDHDGDEATDRVRVRVLPDGRMTREEAAKYLGHAAKTLAMWHLQGRGPPSVKVGGRRFYFKRDLDAFVRGET